MEQQKFDLKDGWYLLSSNPEVFRKHTSTLYYWRVYVENGLPICLDGNKHKEYILEDIGSNRYPSLGELRNLGFIEEGFGQTAYEKMIQYNFPLVSLLDPSDDEIYQLDL